MLPPQLAVTDDAGFRVEAVVFAGTVSYVNWKARDTEVEGVEAELVVLHFQS